MSHNPKIAPSPTCNHDDVYDYWHDCGEDCAVNECKDCGEFATECMED